jgi:cytochrome c oxidase subunit II
MAVASSNFKQNLSRILPEEFISMTERRWLLAMASVLGIMFAIIVLTSAANVLHPPSDVETINPTTLHLDGEFVESNLGPTLENDGSVTVRILAQQYMWVPACVRVPNDTEVRFRLTSADVVHGFFVGETNTNAMVVPGFITEVLTKFNRPQAYKMPCDEYCGYGHHAMAARVVVVTKEEFGMLSPAERISCGSQ